MLKRLTTSSIFLLLLLGVSVFISGAAEANSDPLTVQTISDHTLEVGGTLATIDLSTQFNDPDGDALTYTATSSDTAVATVNVSNAILTVAPVAAGTATITATATDPNGSTVDQTFSVTVTQPNRAPTAVDTIADQALDIGGTDVTVDVSSNFSDADNDTLTYTVSSSDTSIATVSVSSATVTITPVAAGSATITVTATDPDGLTAEQTFSATVTQPNRAPNVPGTIPNQTLNVGNSTTVDISNVFSDPDGDPLTYTVTSSDTSIVTASVSGTTVTITPVAPGTATITVTATDPDGLPGTQSISVTVPNRAPTRVGSYSDVTLTAGAIDWHLIVTSLFSDPDGESLTYSASTSDTVPVDVNMVQNGEVLSVTPKAAGSVVITVTATDPGGLSVTQSFNLSVIGPNRSPAAEGTIPDSALEVGGSDADVDVSTYFTDPNSDTLTYTATSSDTAIATASVSSATVTITAVGAGTATITVTATDPGDLTADQTFSVTVTQPNRAPATVGTISDQALDVGGSDLTVDVSANFSDADGDTLTYTATSSDTTIATVSVSNATVTLTPGSAGSATITATATDPDGLTVDQTFSVTVTQPNRAPAAVGTISDQSVTVGGSVATVDVSANFSDADNDTLTYTATSSDTAKATVSVSSATVTITAVGGGSATITVTATDPDGLTVDQTFSVTVIQPNRAPTAIGTISDQSVNVGGSATPVDVSTNFSDADNDTLTYTATSSDTAKVTVSVSNAIVTITAVAVGTATITVTATDPDGLTVDQTFSTTVTQLNNAPVVASPIPNQRLQANGATITFDAFAHFSDPDGDRLHIVHTETDTNGNVEVVEARTSVAGITTLTPKAAGTASVTVKVRDPSNATAQQTFNVRVNAAPAAVGTIHDRKVEVGGSTDSVDVSPYFSDESDDTLTYTATSNNTAIATVSVSGSTVTIAPVGASVTLITVTATDIDGASVDQTFYARVSGTIPDQTLKVGGDSLTINTSPYFGRKGGDIFHYSVGSSNTAIVDYSPKSYHFGAWLANATIIPVAAGNATITVILTDTNGTTTKTFNVTVYGGPTTIGTIPDITFTSYGSSSDVDLSTYFGAFNTSDLTYTVVSSDTGKATVSVSGTTLTVTSVAAGTSTITARATDLDNAFATQTFTVTVKGPPVANGTIPDQTLKIGGSSVTINVAGYFTDPEGGTLTYDSTLYGAVRVTFDLQGSILTITPGNETGSGKLRISATDPDGLSAKQEFTVTMTHANRAPVASGTIADITKKASDSAATVDLSGYFTDADADTLTYTAISSAAAKATVSLSDATLTVTPVAAGTATITTTATDPDGAFATQTFTMTVTPANRAPVASKTIPDQTIKRVYAPNSSSAVIALADYFSDPDGDALTYTAPNSDTNGVATLNFWTGPGKLSIFPLLADNADKSGTGSITVTATDPDNASVSQTFSVTTSIPPHTVGTIADQYLSGEPNTLTNISTYFKDDDGDTLTYSASSSNTSAVTVSLSGVAITFSKAAGGQGSSTISVTATDPSGFTATQTLTAYATFPPTTVGTIPNISGAVNQAGTTITLSSYFSDPNGQTLTYSATSSNTYVVSVSINSSNGLEVTPLAAGNATITVTATNTDNLSATQSISVTLTASVFVGEADPVPGDQQRRTIATQ